MSRSLSHRLAETKAAPSLAFALRAQYVLEQESKRTWAGLKWMCGTREHTNFTYDITMRSNQYLAAFVSAVSGRPISECMDYLEEIHADRSVQEHVQRATLGASRRGISDPVARIGRRAGWYALVRALAPDVVVETGTDKGLGSVVLAAALLRNGNGRLITIDINEDSGFLVTGEYARVTDRRIGSSLAILKTLSTVDFFIHDSNHDPRYEMSELLAVEPVLAPGAMVLTDNAEGSSALFEWSIARGRQFLNFREEPAVMALPSEGVGASWTTN